MKRVMSVIAGTLLMVSVGSTANAQKVNKDDPNLRPGTKPVPSENLPSGNFPDRYVRPDRPCADDERMVNGQCIKNLITPSAPRGPVR